MHQRPRQRYALPLPTRQARRPFAARARPGRPVPALSSPRARARRRQAQRHVVEHAAPGQQARFLEHDRASRRAGRRSRLPSASNAPSDAVSSPATSRSRVLLPQPLRPTMATNSPGLDGQLRVAQHVALAVALGQAAYVQADTAQPSSFVAGGWRSWSSGSGVNSATSSASILRAAVSRRGTHRRSAAARPGPRGTTGRTSIAAALVGLAHRRHIQPPDRGEQFGGLARVAA